MTRLDVRGQISVFLFFFSSNYTRVDPKKVQTNINSSYPNEIGLYNGATVTLYSVIYYPNLLSAVGLHKSLTLVKRNLLLCRWWLTLLSCLELLLLQTSVKAANKMKEAG